MAVERSYVRLGLFVVVLLALVLATALFFIQRVRSHKVMAAVTYTTENVSGLEVSSPVRYRGVSVGHVSDMRVDPHTGSIEIVFEIFLDRLITIGVDVKQTQAKVDQGVLEKLRAQVVRNPVAGDAYLLLDRPQKAPPLEPLSFTPDKPYVPSMPTPLSKVEDRLPQLLDRADKTFQTLREIVDRIPHSLDRTDRFLTSIERVVEGSQLPELSADTRRFLTTTEAELKTTDAELKHLEQISSDMKKLIEAQEAFAKLAEATHTAIDASELPATTQATRDAANRTSLAADDLRRSLPAIRDSLEQIRELARFLEEQPESVIYGPRRSDVKTK